MKSIADAQSALPFKPNCFQNLLDQIIRPLRDLVWRDRR